MIALIQRVKEAKVTIEDKLKGQIANGLLVLLGIESADNTTDIEWLVNKIINLRIFPDDEQIMNRSLLDVDGEILVVSQFSLHASTKKGNRPSYIKAAGPNVSIPLYNQFLVTLETSFGKPIQTGEFGAYMEVHLINDGPVTIIIDTKDKK